VHDSDFGTKIVGVGAGQEGAGLNDLGEGPQLQAESASASNQNMTGRHGCRHKQGRMLRQIVGRACKQTKGVQMEA